MGLFSRLLGKRTDAGANAGEDDANEGENAAFSERKFAKLVKELKTLVAATRKVQRNSFEAYPEYNRIREIGERLNEMGGMEAMQRAHSEVSSESYFSQDWWNRIGYWRD
jgi:hypothetical protein